MKKVFISILMLAFVSIGFASFTKAPAEESLPSIKLKDLAGKDVDLKDLAAQQKLTIISFWATWCAPCKKELENMNDMISDWRQKYGVQIVAVSIDDSRSSMKVKPYVEGRKWDFNVLLDVNQDTKRLLNWPNVPYTLLVDKSGKIIYKHIGYTEGDEDVLEDKIKEQI